MAEIDDALDRLAVALERAEHPLAIRRPAGHGREALGVTFAEQVDRELPAELAALWQWWGGVEFWPSEPEPPRHPFGDLLPGGVTIESVEAAVQRRDQLQQAELIATDATNLLPIAYLGDVVGHLWCDLDQIEGEHVPVAVHYAEEPPPFEPHWTFASITAWVEAMASLLESGSWSYDQDRSWHASGNHLTWVL